MSENKSQKNARRAIMILVGIIIGVLFISVCLLAGKNGDSERTLKKANQTIEQRDGTINECMYAIEAYDKQIKELQTQLDQTPVDVAGDEILIRDIFIYIDKKFQLVPRTAAEDIARNIVLKSREHGVSPELIVGIIEVESGFNPSAVSSANARGLMQVMPEWAKKFNLKKVSDLHDIDTGIDVGIQVLKIHVDEEGGNLSRGLFKYVGGSDAYAGKVYTAMGHFVAYRSLIPDTTDKQEEKEKA